MKDTRLKEEIFSFCIENELDHEAMPQIIFVNQFPVTKKRKKIDRMYIRKHYLENKSEM